MAFSHFKSVDQVIAQYPLGTSGKDFCPMCQLNCHSYFWKTSTLH